MSHPRRRFVAGAAALATLAAFSGRGFSRETSTTGNVALVLGGGGCRGYGHIGVLRVLEREGLDPSLIVG